MGINLSDPRVRKTRRSLQEALTRLILKQGHDSSSIQDIATESDTARITFYRHYRDKKELLADCLNGLYDDLTLKTEAISRQAIEQGQTPISVLYAHIEQQETLYRILFSSRGTQTVMGAFHFSAKYARHGTGGNVGFQRADIRRGDNVS